MATTKTNKKKVNYKEKIIEAYRKHLLTHGENPSSPYIFADGIGISEKKFYDYYPSFDAVKSAIWEGYMEETLSALEKDGQYKGYQVREKLLAFYYTLIEVLKNDRSFVMLCFDSIKRKEVTPGFMIDFRESFDAYVKNLIEEGTTSNEIVSRPLVGNKYHEALWLQLLFVINYWIKDDSKGFESTDAAIEKAVALSFDLMGPGPLDSILDFAKFLYQNRK